MMSYDVKMETETSLKYIQIAEVEGDESIEVPLEEDGTLLVTTLTAQFPTASGLKYRNPTTNTMRGLRMADGRINAPDGGWGDFVIYYGVFPKGSAPVADNKRKNDDALDEFYGRTGKRSQSVEQVTSDLIVLGLAFNTTEADLKEYCETFGEVVMVKVNTDTKTGKPKGFGFVKFKNYLSQVKVLQQRHEINDRWCDIKIPYSNKQEVPMRSLHNQPRRFYVGRVPESLSTEDLRNYFSTFGELADVFIPRPHRDFAFVTFADSTSLNDLNGQDHIVKNVSVCVKLATPKHTSVNKNQQQNQQQGGGNVNAWASPPPPPPEMPNLQSLGLNLQNNSMPANVQTALQNTVGYLSSQYANSVNVLQQYLQQGMNQGYNNTNSGYAGNSGYGGGYGGGNSGYGGGNSGYGGGNSGYGGGNSGYGGGNSGYGGGNSGYGGNAPNMGYPPPRGNKDYGNKTGYSDAGYNKAIEPSQAPQQAYRSS